MKGGIIRRLRQGKAGRAIAKGPGPVQQGPCLVGGAGLDMKARAQGQGRRVIHADRDIEPGQGPVPRAGPIEGAGLLIGEARVLRMSPGRLGTGGGHRVLDPFGRE